ncbi:hypothetical protein [Pseudonocardia sp. NPDC049154]|uniref:hypothetical protein n=1 Tax=Pseudonocardia sp. NPDC049154 TaxID=3155501 RepID=UPI0033E5F2B6
MLGGAVPPRVATSLKSGFGGIAIGLYLSSMPVISLLCVLAPAETRDRDLTG